MKVTINDIVLKVRELAAKYPENIYMSQGEHCSYSKGNCTIAGTGCIFGQAYEGLGLDRPEDLIDDAFSKGTVSAGINHVLHQTFSELSLNPALCSWCSEVQSNQDRAVPWGKAVQQADTYIPIRLYNLV